MQTLLTREERLVLQELVNISFGDAGAELEEVLGINVEINTPDVEVITEEVDLADYLLERAHHNCSFLLVEQCFWGDFSGVALMFLPQRCGASLVSDLCWFDSGRYESASIEMLEQGAILEVGNILTGVCVGKIAELLGTIVGYSPPRMRNGTEFDVDSEVSVILQTCFHCVGQEVEGRLFIAPDNRSLDWLRSAVSGYVELIS